jgi:ABC-type antimicrobial peptide transport system permease subunit
MVCSVSCSISFIFIVGMIYFYNGTRKNATVLQYKQQLNANQRRIYDNITKERLDISLQGYFLGIVLSLFIIYFFKPKAVVCVVLATSFLTNYFYYMLMPKSDWMLNHTESREQTQAWLNMYRIMQYYYHAGLVLGILGLGVFAYAFRC